MEIRCISPVQTRLCLVEEARVARDISTLLSGFRVSDPSPKPLLEKFLPEPISEDQSWFSWGKDILFPIYPTHQLNKFVRMTDSLFSLVIPQLQCQVKMFNPALLELAKVKIFTTEWTYKQSGHRSESTDPDFVPSEESCATEGSAHELLLYVYLKDNYSVVRLASLRYGVVGSDVTFAGADADVQVAMKGRVSKAITAKALTGKITCADEVTFHTNLESMGLTFSPDQIMAFAEAMTELNLLYSRIAQSETAAFPDLNSLQFHRQSSQSSEEQLQNAEETINLLKSALLSAHSQLISTRDEVARLRAALSSTVGGSLPALAGLLSIDQSCIKAVCLEALYNAYPAKAVLTVSELIILSQEGRLMEKVKVRSMLRLEEQGDEELQVHTEDQALRLMLRNRSEFVRGIQAVFSN